MIPAKLGSARPLLAGPEPAVAAAGLPLLLPLSVAGPESAVATAGLPLLLPLLNISLPLIFSLTIPARSATAPGAGGSHRPELRPGEATGTPPDPNQGSNRLPDPFLLSARSLSLFGFLSHAFSLSLRLSLSFLSQALSLSTRHEHGVYLRKMPARIQEGVTLRHPL